MILIRDLLKRCARGSRYELSLRSVTYEILPHQVMSVYSTFQGFKVEGLPNLEWNYLFVTLAFYRFFLPTNRTTSVVDERGRGAKKPRDVAPVCWADNVVLRALHDVGHMC